MISKLRVGRFAAACLFGLVVSAGTAKAEVAVAAGRAVSLMTMSSIDQACHSEGPVTVNVIDQPHGGFLEITQTKAYPNFNALNTRSRCNTIKLPATRVVYQSTGDFLGIDSVTIEAIFPEGGVKRIHVQVSVRPIAFDPAAPGTADSSVSPPGAYPDEAAPSAAPVPVRPKPRRHAQAHAAAHPRCPAPCDTAAKQRPAASPSTKTAKPAKPPALLTPI